MLRQVSFLGLVLVLTACGGGGGRRSPPPPPPPSYAIGGTISGLEGSGLLLRFSAASAVDLTFNANGPFSGPAFTAGSTYKVTVRDQPTQPWQTCAVRNGTGTLAAPVQNLEVSCTTNTYHVGYTLTGLTGANFALQLNGGAPVPIEHNGDFFFGTPLASGSNYTLAVHTQPDGQVCTLDQPTGTIGGESIDVGIVCTGDAFAAIVRNMFTLDLAYGPASDELYVSTDSGATGPAIAVIDPQTGDTVRTVLMPQRAEPLVVSDDGQYLYAGLGATGLVRRYALPSLTLDLEFSLGQDSTGHPLEAYDIRVAPGNSRTVAVTRYYFLAGYGLAVYDDGIARANTIGDALPPVGLEPDGALWSSDGSKIYSLSRPGSTPRYCEFDVSGTGVSFRQELPLPLDRAYGASVGAIYAAHRNYHMDADRLYSGTGAVFDPARRTQVGAFRTLGQALAIDRARGKAFFASGQFLLQDYTFQSFDLQRMTPIASHLVYVPPNTQGSVIKLVRWGTDGLAAVTTGGQLIIVSGSFVSDPAGPGAPPTPVGPLLESTGNAGAYQYRVYDLPANDVLWDAPRARLYAAVNGEHRTLGNMIAAIDVNLNLLVGGAAVGSEPMWMSASDDGTRMYVTHHASSSVARVDLTSMMLNTVFQLNFPGQGPGYALAAEAVPGDASSFAYIEHYPGMDTLFTRLISNLTLRPMSFDERITTMAFADANTLFANNGWGSSLDYYQIGVVPTGLQLSERAQQTYNFGRMIRSGGLLYSDHGFAVGPATRAVEHSYDPGISGASKAFRANPARDRGYMAFEDAGGQAQLIVFRLGDDTRLATVPLPPSLGSPISLTSMDGNGVAISTSAGKTVIVQGPDL